MTDEKKIRRQLELATVKAHDAHYKGDKYEVEKWMKVKEHLGKQLGDGPISGVIGPNENT